MDNSLFEAWAEAVRREHEFAAESRIAERRLEMGVTDDAQPEDSSKDVVPDSTHRSWDDSELMPQPDVFSITGTNDWRTLENWIENNYFPNYHEIGGTTGRTKMWLTADVYRWQKWKDEKGCRRSYQAWMNSTDPEEKGFE